MLLFLGDIHGSVEVIFEALAKCAESPTAIIQVGDFGFWPDAIDRWVHGPKCPVPVYAIDGNHEYFPLLKNYKTVSHIGNNLFYVPRGTVLNLDGYKIGFMGGAESVDIAWRRKNIDWFIEERVRDEDIELLTQQDELDILVTHAPPSELIDRNFPPIDTISWGLPAEWEDVSGQKISRLWNKLNRPRLICGHMHKHVDDLGCTILNIDEGIILVAKAVKLA